MPIRVPHVHINLSHLLGQYSQQNLKISYLSLSLQGVPGGGAYCRRLLNHFVGEVAYSSKGRWKFRITSPTISNNWGQEERKRQLLFEKAFSEELYIITPHLPLFVQGYKEEKHPSQSKYFQYNPCMLYLKLGSLPIGSKYQSVYLPSNCLFVAHYYSYR